MFRKTPINQEFKNNFKDDAKNIIWVILCGVALAAPVTYLIYRPFVT